MRRGLTYRQKLVLTLILGVSLVFIVYLILRFTVMEKNDELKETNIVLQNQYDMLMTYVQNEPKYRAETEENIKETNRLLNCYLGDVTKSWLLHNYEENLKVYQLESSSLTLNNNDVYNTIVSEDREMVLQTTAVSINYSAKYKNFMRFIRDIRELDENISINSFTISADVDNDKLTGTLSLTQYSVSGNESSFEEPIINQKQGESNIFGVGD